MNSKTKKIGAIILIAITVMSSITYYEYATEPQGLQGICNGTAAYNYTMVSANYKVGDIAYLYSDNVSYLGNKADLMLYISPGANIFNLSFCAQKSSNRFEIEYTSLFISQESYAPLYSHIVISVTNFSIAFNKTMFFNVSTNKGDVFGNNISLCEKGGFSGNSVIYADSLSEPFRGPNPPMTKVIIPGNYTIYENITFTITVSLGILHFTSQEYSIHKSYWELWGYNDVRGGGP